MEAFVALVLIAIGIALFIALVKRTKRAAAALNMQAKPWEGSKPTLLDRTQRKRLGLEPAKSQPSAEPTRRTADNTSVPSRAMRNGWSLGTVSFTYEDSSGDVTCRTVTIHSVTATHLKGECHDRQAERTFRVDRIIGDVVDLESGEIVRPRSLARHFA
ncbi:WYL domain-containing protein [Stutzerimonas nitrititolerans]|uniref:WYL domain-containing protein n=1 Tax=Stutzerimonas nitrititolerans TaxID=2482751 RepID=UPI0028B0A8E7|nr:hypothetical protein [Stutzerimonas nitrititolerans]